MLPTVSCRGRLYRLDHQPTSGVHVVVALVSKRGMRIEDRAAGPLNQPNGSRSSIHSHFSFTRDSKPTTASLQSMAAVGVPTPKRASSTSPGRPPAGPESRIRSMRQIKQVRHA